MHVLLGDTRSQKNLALLQQHGWGRMFQTHVSALFPGERWGFDNCAYLHFRRGESFNNERFLQRLEKAQLLGSVPYIAVVPDIVAGGLRSLEFSWEWFGVRGVLPVEWPWHLAVQDGMTRRDVEGVIRGGWAGLFLGGTTQFKQQTAWMWAELARECGLRFHYGRAGTLRKLEHAKLVRADSLDSAFPLWTSRRMEMFISQYYDQQQPRLL